MDSHISSSQMVASTTGEWGGAYSCHYIHDISQRQHYSESVIHSIKYLCHSNKDHLTRMICSLSGLHWFKHSSSEIILFVKLMTRISFQIGLFVLKCWIGSICWMSLGSIFDYFQVCVLFEHVRA